MIFLKRIFSFLFLVVIASCIDPYTPNLKYYKSLLVVEGLISNENSSYKIKLGRTFLQQNSDPEKVIDANVYIIDGDGIKTELQNCGDGYYKTDSTTFMGTVGQKYTLHILTSDRNEYRSEECTMFPVAGIDKLYYEKSEEISGNLGESFTGLKILLNSTKTNEPNQYFRWSFEEVWKTVIPGAVKYTYKKINDTTFTFRPVPVGKNLCWKKSNSGEIITNSITDGGEKNIAHQEIQFLNPLFSDRLTQEYSVLVKQYSISKKENEFWNNLKKAGESGGDIFASQPYAVVSNIHNVNNTNEMVLGYFEVSAVSQKRIFITLSALNPLHLPNYVSDCKLIVISPDDYPDPKPSWDGLYHMFVDFGYVFVEPFVKDATPLEGSVFKSKLLKFVFSTAPCAMCESTGFTSKPDFWIDLK